MADIPFNREVLVRIAKSRGALMGKAFRYCICYRI